MELFLIMGNKLIYYNVGISFLENIISIENPYYV